MRGNLPMAPDEIPVETMAWPMPAPAGKSVEYSIRLQIALPTDESAGAVEDLSQIGGTEWRSPGAVVAEALQKAEAIAGPGASRSAHRSALWEAIETLIEDYRLDEGAIVHLLALPDETISVLAAEAPLSNPRDTVRRDRGCHLSAERMLGIPPEVRRGSYEFSGKRWCLEHWGMERDFISTVPPYIEARGELTTLDYAVTAKGGFPRQVFEHYLRFHPHYSLRAIGTPKGAGRTERFEGGSEAAGAKILNLRAIRSLMSGKR